MYENADDELQRILKLVESCPEALRPKAFEILLQGYVESMKPRVPAQPSSDSERRRPAPPLRQDQDLGPTIPADVLPRLRAMAKRRNVAPERLAAVFDFSSDPFTFAPVHVPGTAKNDRAKKVALLVAARGFLATSRWVADWAEVKAMCTHQNCYDLPNFSATLKRSKGDIFKAVDVGTGVELSAAGTEQAEALLAELAGPDASA